MDASNGQSPGQPEAERRSSEQRARGAARHGGRAVAALLLTAICLASVGCGPRRHIVVERGALAAPTTSPVLDEMLLAAMERAVGGLALDALSGERIALDVAAPDGADVTRLSRLLIRRLGELEAELTDEPAPDDVSLSVMVGATGVQLLHDREQGWVLDAVCTLVIDVRAPGMAPLRDRAVGRDSREVGLSRGGIWIPTAP
jgi:hypothetical protein